MVAQCAVCSRWFAAVELTLALGLCETSHHLSNFVGKVAVTLGSQLNHSDPLSGTLWFGCAACAFSLCVGGVFFFLERCVLPLATQSGDAIDSHRGGSGWRHVFRALPVVFWLVVLVHLLVSSVEHLFDAVSAHFIEAKWHYNFKKAAWISSLNYVLGFLIGPALGWILDRSAFRMYFVVFASGLMAVAHFLLGTTDLTPVLGLVLLSVAEALCPTILKSAVPLVVPCSAVGVGFGMYGIGESLGKTIGPIGNPLVGLVRDVSSSYAMDESIFCGLAVLAGVLTLVVSWLDAHRGGVHPTAACRQGD